jgi:nucleoside 2-deoxyribosyltransferase
VQKIYIAGPDVFERNSLELGDKYTKLCSQYGYCGLYPLDNQIDFNQEKKKIALEIFLANKQLIDESDIVVANLNSFRGMEADSGTVWECGYAYAKEKKVYAYMESKRDYIKQFRDTKEENGSYWDNEDRLIEDFNLPINLMIACSSIEIVEGGFEDVLKLIQGK